MLDSITSFFSSCSTAVNGMENGHTSRVLKYGLCDSTKRKISSSPIVKSNNKHDMHIKTLEKDFLMPAGLADSVSASVRVLIANRNHSDYISKSFL